MDYQKKFFNLLTICEKSGNLLKGFDVVKEAVEGNKAVCIMTASDISKNTLKEVRFVCRDKKSVNIINLPYSMEDIYLNIGKNARVLAVCDSGFAKKLSEYVKAQTEVSGE